MTRIQVAWVRPNPNDACLAAIYGEYMFTATRTDGEWRVTCTNVYKKEMIYDRNTKMKSPHVLMREAEHKLYRHLEYNV